MGQQQLLLLVLGIVIVGLAVVVGIQAFGENQKKANADALINDAVRIASDAQAWKLKPGAFGGGASVSNWTGLTFAQLGYTASGTGGNAIYSNINGRYQLSNQTAADLTISACSLTASGLQNLATITVANTTPSGISTAVSTGSCGF